MGLRRWPEVSLTDPVSVRITCHPDPLPGSRTLADFGDRPMRRAPSRYKRVMRATVALHLELLARPQAAVDHSHPVSRIYCRPPVCHEPCPRTSSEPYTTKPLD